MIESNVGPVFKHDCDDCEYLGHYEEHDLYYCSSKVIPTVIARWGGYGPHYSSGIEVAESVQLDTLTHGKGLKGTERYNSEEPVINSLCALRVAYLIAKDLGREMRDSMPPASLR